MAHSTVVPPVSALGGNGHLPHIVQAADAEAQRLAQLAAGPCPVFRDCTMTEPGHYDHSGHDMVLTDRGDRIFDAGMVALSGSGPDSHAIVYLHNAEFESAAAVKAKTAELRRMLDEVDAMADRVFVDHEARA